MLIFACFFVHVTWLCLPQSRVLVSVSALPQPQSYRWFATLTCSPVLCFNLICSSISTPLFAYLVVKAFDYQFSESYLFFGCSCFDVALLWIYFPNKYHSSFIYPPLFSSSNHTLQYLYSYVVFCTAFSVAHLSLIIMAEFVIFVIHVNETSMLSGLLGPFVAL